MPHPDMNASWENGHPDEGLLHEWLDEQLLASEAARIETHVTECGDCAARVAEARGLVAAAHRILSALDEVPANVVPAHLAASAPGTLPAHLAASGTSASANQARGSNAAVPGRAAQFRWRRIGQIAAVLMVAVAGGSYFLRGNDVRAPLPEAFLKSESPVPAAADVQANASGAAAQSTSATSIPEVAAGGAPAASAAGRQPTAATGTQRISAAGAPPVSATGARPAPKDGGQQASAPASVIATRESREQSRRADDVAAPKRVANLAATDSIASAPLVPPSATPPATPLATPPALSRVTALQGKVAGIRITSDTAAPIAPPAAASPRPLADERVRNAPAATPPVVSAIASGAARGAGPPRDSLVAFARSELDRAKSAVTGALRDTAVGQGQAQGRARAFSARPEAEAASRAQLDSLTLSRTVCTTSCETTTLQVNALGLVRFSLSAGGSERQATSQLTPANRSRLQELVRAVYRGQPVSRIVCTVSDGARAPSLRLTVAHSPTAPFAETPRCTLPTADLVRLGAAIDSVADSDALRRRVPPDVD